MEMLTVLAEIASTKPIDRDTFNPATWDNNEDKHLWWAWFNDAQLKQFQHSGTVPGFREAHGDNAHHHHRFRNRPDHCLNLAIHCRWTRRDNSSYATTTYGGRNAVVGANQSTSLFGNNRWHTFVVLHWPL
eukprot:609883-Amphidinium_carterae.2